MAKQGNLARESRGSRYIQLPCFIHSFSRCHTFGATFRSATFVRPVQGIQNILCLCKYILQVAI